MTTVKVLDVEIPVDAGDFITPDWTRVLEFYSIWVGQVDWSRYGEVWPIQPYMLQFSKELEKIKARIEDDGHVRTADQWMQRFFEHFGLSGFERFVNRSRRAG